MASKGLFLNDKKKRKLALKLQKRKFILKFLFHNFLIPFSIRNIFFFKIFKQKKYYNVTRVRNRCIFTYRSRGVYRLMKVSRICIRNMAGQGVLPGLFKASW